MPAPQSLDVYNDTGLLGEFLLRLLVDVGHLHARSKDRIVGMLRGEGCGGLGGKFFEFGGCDTMVDSLV